MVYKDGDNPFDRRPVTGGSYEKSPRGSAFADFVILSAVFAVTLLFIYAPYINHGVIRFALGFFSVLFIPGYLLIAAVFPRKDDLGGLERFLLSVTFSVILVPMACLVLNYTAWGIRLNTVIAVVAILAGAGTLAAFARRLATPADRRFAVSFGWLYGDAKKLLLPASRKPGDILISAALACSLLLSIIVMTYAVAAPGIQEKYTEFYISGAEGNLSHYPVSYVLGESKNVIAGISNHEGSPEKYILAVMLDNGSQRQKLFEEPLVVDSNQTIEENLTLMPVLTGARMKMQFLLYLDNANGAPYRECDLWVKVITKDQAATEATEAAEDTLIRGNRNN